MIHVRSLFDMDSFHSIIPHEIISEISSFVEINSLHNWSRVNKRMRSITLNKFFLEHYITGKDILTKMLESMINFNDLEFIAVLFFYNKDKSYINKIANSAFNYALRSRKQNIASFISTQVPGFEGDNDSVWILPSEVESIADAIINHHSSMVKHKNGLVEHFKGTFAKRDNDNNDKVCFNLKMYSYEMYSSEDEYFPSDDGSSFVVEAICSDRESIIPIFVSPDTISITYYYGCKDIYMLKNLTLLSYLFGSKNVNKIAQKTEKWLGNLHIDYPYSQVIVYDNRSPFCTGANISYIISKYDITVYDI